MESLENTRRALDDLAEALNQATIDLDKMIARIEKRHLLKRKVKHES